MHELFTKVLSRKDLSRAGDLFSVADAEIVVELSDVVSESKRIYKYIFDKYMLVFDEVLILKLIRADRGNKWHHLPGRLLEKYQWSIGRWNMCYTGAVVYTGNKNRQTILCIVGEIVGDLFATQSQTVDRQ